MTYGGLCGLDDDGFAYCWGYSSGDYELGDPDVTTDSAFPVAVSAPEGESNPVAFTELRLGEYFACATTDDDDTYCWGANRYGQAIFSKAPTDISRPEVRFEAASFVPASFALGEHHGCVLDQDERAHCWGDNYYSQLGRSTDEDPADIGEVEGDLRFTELVSGDNHVCGLAKDGKAYCWGYNGSGQLGTGDFENAATPTAVVGQ